MSEGPPAPRELFRIAVMAVLVGLVHLAGTAATHESRLAAQRATDAQLALQSLNVRETLLTTAGNSPGHDNDVRAAQLGEALRLRHGSGGIVELQGKARQAATRSEALALIASEYGLAEAGLQVAILLVAVAGLSIAWRLLGKGGLALAGLSLLVTLVASADWVLG